MKRTLVIVIVLIAVGITAVVMTYKGSKPVPHKPNVVPYTEVRNDVKGKTADDVAKIVLLVPEVGVLTITKKADIAELLDGLREAVYVNDKIGLAGPTITIYWANGKKSYDYMFVNSKGPDYAFGEKFAKAFNRLVPPGSRVKMKHRTGKKL